MRKSLILVLSAWILCFVMGIPAESSAGPIMTGQDVADPLSIAEQSVTLKTGTFKDANFFHRGQGTATITESKDGRRIVSLTDFEVTNGPDLEIYVVENSNITDSDSVLESRHHSLGVLKNNTGNQNYDIPADIDFNVGSVVIWCELFSVLFSAAAMQ